MNIKMKESVFIRKMHQFIMDEELIPAESNVCCALSGGADSVALLLGILALRDELSIGVSAVHVNHHLRGEESNRDGQFCRELCRKLGIRLHVHHCDVMGYREENGGSIETAARTCRYEAFSMEKGFIATAHTASDNLETILQRLARGTGLHGLCGIPVRRSRFIRPILFASREEVEEFLREQGQDYVTDSSNESDDYTRNRIRHNIVPLLRELNPSVEKTAANMCRTLRRDDNHFEAEAEGYFCDHFREPACLKKLSKIPEAVRVRCMARLLDLHGISYDARMLEDMERLVKTGGRCHLAGEYDCLDSRDELVLTYKEADMQNVSRMLIQTGEQSIYQGFGVQCRIINEKNEINACIVDRNFTNCLLDYDKIKGCITLRGRIPGDKIHLAGRDFTASIKKRIQEDIPLHRRKTLHFLEDEEGTVYAEGIGIADRVKPEYGETKRLLIITVIDRTSIRRTK